MAELSPQTQERPKEGLEDDTPTPTPDVHSVSMKSRGPERSTKHMEGLKISPQRVKLCQTVGDPPVPRQGWLRSHKDLQCKENEMRLLHNPQTPVPKQKIFCKLAVPVLNSSRLLGSCHHGFLHIHMLRHSDHFTALWVVSIFSGLKWGLGMIHIFSTNRATASFTDSESNPAPMTHIVSIFRYPHAAGSLAGVFLSSFTSMCIFGAGLLYAIGYLCIKTKHILFLWLIYFLIPLFLPLAHPLQQFMKSDAEKMQLLGFILSSLTSGFGFYYQGSTWGIGHLLLFAAIQGTSTGLLHASRRVLWLDCSPAGKEGAFSVWFSWARALGACAGFALATAMPGDVGKAFGVSFCAGLVGMIVLIFGNISSFRGAKAAGHVIKSEKNSPVHGLDDDHVKGSVTTEVLPQGKIDV
ncbi:hypothetical protein Sango_2251900 [Sesamum angolense]|uniref:Uncharacterized protein n=1 Tax=Sesamum angolense TaxID=2727404 RepID=A0AAE2BKY6_9LAMI|nr:hypothetical protein Sango_2251900 [Sesamum angolense]